MMASAKRAAVGASSGRTITVDGVSLAYDDAGAGSAVVCLHAVGHGAGDFVALGRRLRTEHRVVALDWPGQGASGPDREPPRAARYVTLLEGTLDALGIRQAVLVGNSIGAATAIRFAHAHPDRVTGMVLANPGGLDVPDRLARGVVRAMVRFFAAGERGAAWFPTAFASYYRLVLQRSAAATQRAHVVASGTEIAPLLRAAWQGFASADADIRTHVAALTCPVLFAWATRDAFVQLGRALPSIRRVRHGRLVRFPAGHSPQLETPEAFEAEVEVFLAREVASPARVA